MQYSSTVNKKCKVRKKDSTRQRSLYPFYVVNERGNDTDLKAKFLQRFQPFT